MFVKALFEVGLEGASDMHCLHCCISGIASDVKNFRMHEQSLQAS